MPSFRRLTAPLLAGALAVVLVASCGAGEESAARPAAETPTPAPASTPKARTPEGDGRVSGAPARTARRAQRRGVRLVSVGRFDSPLYVTAPPRDRRRVFVVEQEGRVRVLRGGRRLERPFLDIRSLVQSGGEQGLLSLAFAPDYARSRRFYVYYTDREAQQRVVEYRAASPDRADPGSARLVLRMEDPEPNHNGGLLLFGPDGLLYIGTGDGGGGGDQHGPRGNAQDLGSLLGKILRIEPTASGDAPYRVPTSNPFVGREGARGEVYAYGLRNPWRFSFDRRTQDFSVADVGQNAWEEVSFVRRERLKGANFGWRPFEARSRYAPGEEAPGHIAPVIARSHDDGWCSVTGGVVVRDPELAGLAGRYVFGDFCRPQVLAATLRPGRARNVRGTGLRVPALSSFGEDARGRVYATSLQGGVYRLTPR